MVVDVGDLLILDMNGLVYFNDRFNSWCDIFRHTGMIRSELQRVFYLTEQVRSNGTLQSSEEAMAAGPGTMVRT